MSAKKKVEYKEITLGEIETMIDILSKFVGMAKRAETVLSRLGRYSSRMGFKSPQQLMQALLMQRLTEQLGVPSEVTIKVETEEAKTEELESILEKIRGKRSD